MYRLLVLVNPEHMVGYVSLMKGRPSQSRMLKDGFALIRQIRDRHNTIRTYPHTREAKKLLQDLKLDLYMQENGEYPGWRYGWKEYEDPVRANRCKQLAISIGLNRGLYILNTR